VFLAILTGWIALLVHEVARLPVAWVLGARPERVRFGIGKPLRTWTRKGTEYQLAPIPVGAFFRYPGSVPSWKRILAIITGPISVYGLACLTLFAFVYCHGLRTESYYQVERTQKGYDAHGKLEPGDVITAVGKTPVRVFRGASLMSVIQNQARPDQPLAITIERDGQTRDVAVTPRLDPNMLRPNGMPSARLGVILQIKDVHARPPLTLALKIAVKRPAIGVKRFYNEIFTGDEEGELTGPVGIATWMRRRSSKGFWAYIGVAWLMFLYLAAVVLVPLAFARVAVLAVNRDSGYL
jgi:membrane-associated protease RseP (regulator of RpoE activity)